MSWALVIHGGAGEWHDAHLPAAFAAVRTVVQRVSSGLAEAATALDAVCEAVAMLEDEPIFNAGTGSVLNRDGEVEMDASVMNGMNLCFGGVAAITRVRNPVHVARCVMEHSPHALLAGAGALQFARLHGFADHDPITERARKEYLRRTQAAAPGTVGAVALDIAGNLAAATSTGGIALKLPGRVGDSPLPGAGTYAGSAAAVSATGKGEHIMRMLASKRIHDCIEAGYTANDAISQTLNEIGRRVGSGAGFIAVTSYGEIGVGHDTPAMVYGYRSDTKPEPTV